MTHLKKEKRHQTEIRKSLRSLKGEAAPGGVYKDVMFLKPDQKSI